IPKLMVNAAAGPVSIQWGLRGPSSAVATASASPDSQHNCRHHPGVVVGGSHRFPQRQRVPQPQVQSQPALLGRSPPQRQPDRPATHQKPQRAQLLVAQHQAA
ncbi:MAG: hypothetical protein H7Z42_03835, partial [Roseiflexaceae bacterium]|nr:hypothetical protein [Roseiflexaceae bacterium]